MIDRFEELINELSLQLGIPLHPDKIGACTLQTKDGFEVQLECDRLQEKLLIVAFICDVPPGKLRENVFKDALKANGPYPQHGILSFSESNNKLALFAALPFTYLSGHTLCEFLNAFLDKASQWKNGVETGRTSELLSSQTSKPSRGMFGLRP
jgi:Tir chaperone protein (CesT) family